MMQLTRRFCLALALTASVAARAEEQAGSGPLRIALVRGNLAQHAVDAATGERSGISVDIAREIARRLGRPLDIVLLSPAEIVEAAEQKRIDLGFVAPTPGRTGTVPYSRTYMLVQQSAIVVANGPITSVTQLDRPGQRVGANAGDSVAGYLARNLRQATVIESADGSMREALSWVRGGTVVGFAGNRQRLAAAIRREAGLQLLPDDIYAVPQAVAVANPDLLTTVEATLEEMLSTGAFAESLRRNGVDGVSIAP